MPDIGALLQRRYRIKQELGRGGMGAVYSAEDTRLNNAPVAVKETFFSADALKLREQFEREATLLARLQHRALPGVRDHFAEGSGQFLVMEFIAGDDLGKLLRQERKPFDAARVMAWADTLLDALDYIHTQYPPVIHRDIKPENLKLAPRGDLYLLDFGLAKEGTTPTRPGKSIHGYTLVYAPPEQIKGTGTDARSDLYSLGATLYHLCTNQPPADAKVRELQMLQYAMPDPLKPAHLANALVPFAFAAVLSKALALEPARRHQSAAEMREALRQARQFIADQQRQREDEQRLQQALAERERQAQAQREREEAIRHAEQQRQEELAHQREAQAWREREEAARLAAEQRQLEQAQLRELQEKLRREEEARRKAEERLQFVAPYQPLPPTELPRKPVDDVATANPKPEPIHFDLQPPTMWIEQSVRSGSKQRELVFSGLILALMIAIAVVLWNQEELVFSGIMLAMVIASAVMLWNLWNQRAFLRQHTGVYRTFSPASDTPLIGDLCIEMVDLPGGTFTMGSNDGNYDDENPPHQVTVSAFAIGKYEVTQAQWQKVMGNNPSRFKGDNLPVENVSWEDAQAFCRKLGNGYRLPTEAEWEYAARAGSTGKWSFGDDESKLGNYAWFSGNSSSQTHPVGQKKANRFGLFDMHGNVWEWCEDDWHPNYTGAPTDGRAWKQADISARGSRRVYRGGSWHNYAVHCRSGDRGRGLPGHRNDYLGFRLSRTYR